MLRLILLLATMVWVAGCSVHPLPQDVTGFDTVQIVAKVRCEVRDAIRSYLLNALMHPKRLALHPRYALLAEEIQHDWSELRSLLTKYQVDTDTMGVFERYNGGAIAYEFMFDITENNSQQAGFDLLRLVSRGSVSAGIGGSATFNRKNIRDFMVADNFERLITLFDAEYCGPGSLNGTRPEDRQTENFAYPVVGSLGLRELVGAFFNLNQSGNLVGLPNSPADVGLLPTISEKLQFTTTFAGGAGAGFTRQNDDRRVLRLEKASFRTDNSRADYHTLRIVMKLPLDDPAQTRTIAEQRLEEAGVARRRGASVNDLVRDSAILDITLAPGKEYIETKIQVGAEFGVLLPN